MLVDHSKRGLSCQDSPLYFFKSKIIQRIRLGTAAAHTRESLGMTIMDMTNDKKTDTAAKEFIFTPGKD